MKYEISFTGSKAEKEQQALRATREYMGTARYLAWRRKLVDLFLDKHAAEYPTTAKRYRAIKFCALLSGVQGYWPVRAIARDVLGIVHSVNALRSARGPLYQ